MTQTEAIDQVVQQSQPFSKLEEIEANLAFRENEPMGIVLYEDLKQGEGHAQGDLKIQFLGDMISSQLRESIEPVDSMFARKAYSIAGTSHALHGEATLFSPINEHPLISNLLYTDSGFEVRHDEHSWVQFRQPGWYALRFDRTGAVKPEQIGKPLRTVD